MQNPPFVKKFDFRGVYQKDIFDEDAFYVGLALQKVLNPQKILLGWDSRVSSKSLAFQVLQVFKNSNVEIYYLDTVPIDFVTAASFVSDFDMSIMFTGSHNTWEWTGFLIHVKGGKSLQGDLVSEVVAEYYKAQESEKYVQEEVNLLEFHNYESEISKIFTDKIKSLIPLAEIKPQEIIVDIGDGSGSKSLTILENLLPQVKFTRICDRQKYDTDSLHTADPSEEKNMEHIKSEMKQKKYDAGFVFDSDGDRVLALDENLHYLNGSVLGSALIQTFSMVGITCDHVGYAVECGPSIYNTVVDLNKTNRQPIVIQPIPVGRSIVRGMVFDSKIDFGLESVGHFYIKDFFKTDSAAFAVVCILYWISVNGNLSKLIEKHPDGQRFQTSQELHGNLDSQDTRLLQEVAQKFEGCILKTVEVDGTRVEVFDNEYMESWIACRKSGYEAIEKYYCGSLHQQNFEFLQGQITSLKG